MRFFTLVLFLQILLFEALVAQESRTIYFDYNWKITHEPAKASYYRVIKIKDKKHYYIEDYFISGDLQMSGSLLRSEAGEKDGFFVYYFKNLQKRAEGHYVNNKYDGKWINWFPNGAIESIQYYDHRYYQQIKNDETGELSPREGRVGTWEIYSKDGFKIKTETYSAGLMIGEQYFNINKDPDYWKERRYFDFSNTVVQSEREKLGYKYYGLYRDFYFNGNVCRVASFVDNYLKGLYEVFYPNGQIKIRGSYDSSIPSVQTYLFEDNVVGTLRKNVKFDFYAGRDGLWQYFSPDGNLIQTEYYEKGKILDDMTRCVDYQFYDNANVKISATMQKDKYDGQYTVFFENGQIHKIYNFESDYLRGAFYEYCLNGKLKISGRYDSAKPSVYRPVSDDGRYDVYDFSAYIDFEYGRAGSWLYYDEDGKLVRKEKYKKGILKRTRIIN